MRRLTFFAALFVPFISFAQVGTVTGGAAIPFTGNQLQPTYLSGLISQPLKNLFENRNIKGSPYLATEYKPGFVKIKNGYSQNNVPVRFNIYNNQIEFKLNDVEMSLDSMDQVLYLNKAGDSSSIKLFKTGYPPVNDNKETTIYEVIVMGENAHLIKHFIQKIEERKAMGMPNERMLETYSTLYLFDPKTKTIAKVKNAKEQLSSFFPNSSSTIERIIKEKNLSIKNEMDLGELITDLNKIKALNQKILSH